MNAYKKLINNSLIFMIANMGSKLITFLLVPFYTYYLTSKDYGNVDLMTTTISLLLPLVSLCIYEATMRFTIKSHIKKEEVLSSTLFVYFISNIILFPIMLLLQKIDALKDYITILYLILLIQGLNQIISQYVRGIGKVKLYALNGIIYSFALCISNIIALKYLNMGIQGYILSILLSCIVSNIYLVICGDILRDFNKKHISLKTVKLMILYSIPLVPNAVMWWIMNASDRYIISYNLGAEANGIYAVAYKIPTLLTVLYSIFYQAWQISAVEESDSDIKREFYSKVFNNIALIMFISTSIILIVIKPILYFTVDYSYYDCYKFIPFLLLGTIFCNFSTFLGVNYVAMQKTKGTLITTIVGGVLNLVLNIILIPWIGINGAAVSTMISYLVVWIIRAYDTRTFVRIDICYLTFIGSIILLFVQIALYYSTKGIASILLQLAIFIIIIIINKQIIYNIISKVLSKKRIRKVNV